MRRIIVLAGIAFLIGMLWIPEAKWAADGFRTLPVRVEITDAETQHPIAGALIGVFVTDSSSVRNRVTHEAAIRMIEQLPPHETVGTDSFGIAQLDYEFSTVSSQTDPVTKINLQRVTLCVVAEGYTPVTRPLDDRSKSLAELLKSKGCYCRVSLARE